MKEMQSYKSCNVISLFHFHISLFNLRYGEQKVPFHRYFALPRSVWVSTSVEAGQFAQKNKIEKPNLTILT